MAITSDFHTLMQSFKTIMLTETFPAEHQDFYMKFEVWRKKMLKENMPRSGVYLLYSSRPIGRLVKVDKGGVLYIGKGVILPYNNRLGKFVNSLNSTEISHHGGNRINLKPVLDIFNPVDLFIKVTLSVDPEHLESKKLNDYYEEFGELPPLNRRLESYEL